MQTFNPSPHFRHSPHVPQVGVTYDCISHIGILRPFSKYRSRQSIRFLVLLVGIEFDIFGSALLYPPHFQNRYKFLLYFSLRNKTFFRVLQHVSKLHAMLTRTNLTSDPRCVQRCTRPALVNIVLYKYWRIKNL